MRAPRSPWTPSCSGGRKAKAAEFGISFAEYVRRLVADDLGGPKPKADISSLFGLIDEGPPTNIARDKDKMIGDAVWEEYFHETGRKPVRSVRRKAARR